MDHAYRYHMRWTKGVDTSHQVELDLKLDLENVLPYSRDLKTELKVNEEKVRREIFDLIIEKLVPQLVGESGEHSSLPEGLLSTKSHDTLDNKAALGIPTRPDFTLFVRNRIHLLTTIETDRPVNAMQALYGNRGGIAASITNNIMHMLKKQLMGVDDSHTSTESTLSGDKIQELKHHIRRSSADDN